MRPRVPAMAVGELVQVTDDRVHTLAHHEVAPDDVGVAVDQFGFPARQPAAAVKIEEDRTAADEGLEIRAEALRIELPDLRQQLALAARPFQKGPDRFERVHCPSRRLASRDSPSVALVRGARNCL